MDRREFLVRVTIGGATMPILVRQIGCDDGGGGPDTGAETFTSLPDQTSHVHTITIPDADIAAGGAHAYTSSNNAGHSHRVAFTAAEIDNMSVGCSVRKISDEQSGHAHTWLCRFPELASPITAQSEIDVTAHRHGVTIPPGDINSAPAVRDYTTTTASNHQHELRLTQAEFLQLQECQTVAVETEPDQTGHTHAFRLRSL